MAEQKGQVIGISSSKPLQGAARVAALEKKVENIGGQISEVLNMVKGLVADKTNRDDFAQEKAMTRESMATSADLRVVSGTTAGIPAPPGMQWEEGSGIVGGKQTFTDPSYKPQMLKVEPLPMDWVKLKDQMLGPEYVMEAEQFSARPYIQVHIIVPDNFSNVPVEQRSIKKYDRRSKVVSTAAALPELSEWFNKVRQNLRETQSTYGRAQPLNVMVS